MHMKRRPKRTLAGLLTAPVLAAMAAAPVFAAFLPPASSAAPQALGAGTTPDDMADAEGFAALVGRFQAYSDVCGSSVWNGRLLPKARVAVRRRFREVRRSGADADRAMDVARAASRTRGEPTTCGGLRQEQLIVTNAISKERDPEWRAAEPLNP